MHPDHRPTQHSPPDIQKPKTETTDESHFTKKVVHNTEAQNLIQETSWTSGPNIFQSNPASSNLTRPFRSATNFSATLELPVKRVIRGFAC